MGDGHALHFVAFWVRKGTFQPLEDPIIIARLIFATIYICERHQSLSRTRNYGNEGYTLYFPITGQMKSFPFLAKT